MLFETIEKKYDYYRVDIDTGDILLIRGKGALSKAILWADNASYSHALLAFRVGDRIFAIESLGNGVTPNFLSLDIKKASNFCILKVKADQELKNIAFNDYLEEASRGIPYDYWELPKILLKEKFGINVKNIQGNPHEAICSVSSMVKYGRLVPIECYQRAYKEKGYLTPEDGIRYADPKEICIIGNDYI